MANETEIERISQLDIGDGKVYEFAGANNGVVFDTMEEAQAAIAAGTVRDGDVFYVRYTTSGIVDASDVNYDGTTSGLESDNVQDAIDELNSSFSNALTNLKNTAIAQAVGAIGSTFTSVIAKLGEIVNRGKVTKTLDTSTTSYTIPQGYHDGTGSVNIVTQEKSVAPTSSSQNITPDSGKVLSKVVVNAISPINTAGTVTDKLCGADTTGPFAYFPYGWWPLVDTSSWGGPTNACYIRFTNDQTNAMHTHSATYTANSRGSALDMGSKHKYRYVNTSSVPNSNSSSLTLYRLPYYKNFDMGATNDRRYVTCESQFYITCCRPNLYNKEYKLYFAGGYWDNTTAKAGRTSTTFGSSGTTVEFAYSFYYNPITIRYTRSGNNLTKIEVKSTTSGSKWLVGMIGNTGGTTQGSVTTGYINSSLITTGDSYKTLWSGTLYTFFNASGTTAASASWDVWRADLGTFAMFCTQVTS